MDKVYVLTTNGNFGGAITSSVEVFSTLEKANKRLVDLKKYFLFEYDEYNWTIKDLSNTEKQLCYYFIAYHNGEYYKLVVSEREID